jgi:hypothetical protein
MTIEQRLQRLEHENRLLKCIVVTAGLIAASLLVVAANNSPSERIIAKHVSIVDDDGRERMSLFTDPRTSSPMLLMFDDQKRPLVTVSAAQDRTGIAFQDGGSHSYLGTLNGIPNLMLASPEGDQIIRAALEKRGPRIHIGANKVPVIQMAAYDGVPTIGMSDTDSTQRVLLRVARGIGLVSVIGKNAQRGANVTLTADEQFATAEATDRFGGFAQLGTAQEQEPSVGLTIYAKDGSPTWSTRTAARK